MSCKVQSSTLTASGDTTKTLIDTVTVPQGVKKLVGVVHQHAGAATLTSGEPVTGLFELESDDLPMVPMQFPTATIDILTSGACALNPFIWPVDVPVVPGSRIKGYITMDMAQTGALKSRFTLIYE